MIYDRFNEFCIAHFGAAGEPLVRETFGEDLRIVADGAWRHVSESSACLAWETNLPAKGSVEYGPTARHGTATGEHERHFYLHVHYLKDLEPDTTYHYRLTAVDERGSRVATKDATFTTRTLPGAVRVPDDLPGPPWVLDRPGATYLVTGDLTAEGTAFDVRAEDVTVDLGGHTVVWDERHWGPVAGDEAALLDRAKFGLRALSRTEAGRTRSADGLRILNGVIRQGAGDDGDGRDTAVGYNPIYAGDISRMEAAGLTVEYSGPQMVGLYCHRNGRDIDIHHNVFLDTGRRIANRHGTASRPISVAATDGVRVHHNLIKRCRHMAGLAGNEVYKNETYVDSYDTNAIGHTGGEVRDNRLFGGGYHVVGVGWTDGMRVRGNFIHLHAEKLPDPRSVEFGPVASCNGIRLTQYSRGNKPYRHNLYHDNTIVISAADGRQARGVQFTSHANVEGLLCRDSTIKVVALDEATTRASCIVAQGYRDEGVRPVVYRNCTLISNVCHVRFGDDYSRGSNHHVEGCRFVRVGARPDYHTFIFDGGFDTDRHVVLDGEFGEGTRHDDVRWEQTGSASCYAVAWTATIRTAPGAEVAVADATGREEFRGVADAAGVVDVPLTQCVIRPIEWAEGAEPVDVVARDRHRKVVLTPHTITIAHAGATRTISVTMDRPRDVSDRARSNNSGY